jgi:hypothetical protein
MKININVDEWYPIYDFTAEGDRWYDPTSRIYKVPPEKVGWLKRVFEDFEKAQLYLSDLKE